MESVEPTTRRLYSPGQAGVAALLGSPIAACWFLARNYRQLGHPGSATQCLIWGALGTLAVFIAAFFLPDNFPNTAIPIGYTMGLYQAAKQIHGSTVAQHLAADGRLGSWWAVVGNSLLFLVGVLAVFLGVVLLFPDRL